MLLSHFVITTGGKYGWKNGMKLLFKVIMAKLPLAEWLAINLKHKWIEYQEAKKSVLEVRRPGCL